MTEAAQAVEDTAPETSAPELEQQEPASILEGVEAPAQEPEQQEVVNTPENPDARPDWLPEKFNSPEELVKSYNELGAKIREKNEPPETYELKLPEGVEGLSDDDVAAFKEVGLTNDQAQKLTEYLYEAVVPALSEAKVSLEKERLSMDWNMRPDSTEFAQQLASVKAWAQQNLPEAVVGELAKTANGVMTMSRLMKEGASQHRAVGTSHQNRPTQADLQAMMQDERYWKGDEDYRRYVSEQFKLAYD